MKRVPLVVVTAELMADPGVLAVYLKRQLEENPSGILLRLEGAEPRAYKVFDADLFVE